MEKRTGGCRHRSASLSAGRPRRRPAGCRRGPRGLVRGLPPGDPHQSLFPLITTRSGLNCKCI